jgi:hypothetical protein
MAHFAELDQNNVVLRVLVVSNEDITDSSGNEQETLGVAFLQRLFGADTRWVRTSYGGSFRGSYAGAGMIYDAQADQFVSLPEHPALVRARDSETGQFLADDPTTPENEAWVVVSDANAE